MTTMQKKTITQDTTTLRATADAAVDTWREAKAHLDQAKADVSAAHRQEEERRKVTGPVEPADRLVTIRASRAVLDAETRVWATLHAASLALDEAELAEAVPGAFDAESARAALRPLLAELERRQSELDEVKTAILDSAAIVRKQLQFLAQRAKERKSADLPPIAFRPSPGFENPYAPGAIGTLDAIKVFAFEAPAAGPYVPDHTDALRKLATEETEVLATIEAERRRTEERAEQEREYDRRMAAEARDALERSQQQTKAGVAQHHAEASHTQELADAARERGL